jgi:dihydroorotase
MQPLLIRGGTVINSERSFRADVLVIEGKIAMVEDSIPVETRYNVVDAGNLYVMPGVFDPQVHFRDPGFEHKEDLESGSRAAAAGGVTSFLEMPNTVPNTVDLKSMSIKKDNAKKKSWVNYNFFIGATGDNLLEINSVPNVCGIKIFMGSSTGNLLVDDPERLENIFANGKRLIAVHAEDEVILNRNKKTYKDSRDPKMHPVIRSTEAALSATKLAVGLSKKYKRRLHVLHLTTVDEVHYLSQEKSPYISSEVCPQHFLLNAEECYDRLGTLAQMNPPIRDKSHGNGLRNGLKAGIIDCIATDHSPHTLEEKQQPYGKAPSGMPGVETSFPLMLNEAANGFCTYNELVKWMCEMPARLYSALDKGRVEPGFDADIVLVDKDRKAKILNEKLQCKVKWSAFHNKEITGWPVMTIVNGKIVYDDGNLHEPAGKEILIYN